LKTFSFLVGAVVVLAGPARADLAYTMKTKALAMDPPTLVTHRISLAADRMALHSEADGKATDFVFRGDQKLLWMIEPASKAYMQVDEASVKALAAQVGPMMEEMQERLAKLPPEQRATMEEILNMKAKGPEQPEPKIELRSTGAKEKIAGYDCSRWDVLRDGTKTSEVWVTSWKAAGATKQDFAVLKQFSEFTKMLHAASPATRNLSRDGDLISEMDRVDGFPVRIRQFEGQDLASESTLEAVESQKIAPATFEVPAGYARRQFGPARP
jgi:hypothetical protein